MRFEQLFIRDADNMFMEYGCNFFVVKQLCSKIVIVNVKERQRLTFG